MVCGFWCPLSDSNTVQTVYSEHWPLLITRQLYSHTECTVHVYAQKSVNLAIFHEVELGDIVPLDKIIVGMVVEVLMKVTELRNNHFVLCCDPRLEPLNSVATVIYCIQYWKTTVVCRVTAITVSISSSRMSRGLELKKPSYKEVVV